MIPGLWKDARLRRRRDHYGVLAILWFVGAIYITIRCKQPILLDATASSTLISATPDPETFLYSRYVGERDNEAGDPG